MARESAVKTAEKVEVPKEMARQLGAIPVRTRVQREVSETLNREQEGAKRVTTSVYNWFDNVITGSEDTSLKKDWKESSLATLMKQPDLFNNCEVQYAYNQRQKIYSIRTNLDNRPRIITVRTGENFTELSLADTKGNVLEMARQEDGKGLRFTAA